MSLIIGFSIGVLTLEVLGVFYTDYTRDDVILNRCVSPRKKI